MLEKAITLLPPDGDMLPKARKMLERARALGADPPTKKKTRRATAKKR